ERRGVIGEAIRADRLVVSNEADLVAARAAALGHEFSSGMAVPLRAKDELLGVLSIYSTEAGAFDAEEVRLLQELANDLAFGVASLREVVRREAAECALDYHANHDAVTGLANRGLFSDRLRQAIAQAARAGRQVAVIVLSLDRFRAITDNLGHETGNLLLRHAADAMAAVLREGDTIARLGGEEFAVAIGDLQHENDLMPITLKLQEALGAPMAQAAGDIFSSVSMGISLYPKDDAGADALLRAANAALSTAQAAGGDCFRFYAPEINARLSALFAMESALRQALAQGELEVHYQPKVGLAGGKMSGAEALLRWRHPELGPVSPAEFIPLAESTGLILPLGSWVVREVCRQQRAWLDAGLEIHPVSVNLSARQLRQSDLAQQILQALHDNRLDAAFLQMEVTESSLMDDVDEGTATLSALRAIGIKLYLDDFGTGHSSLSRLRKLPIDYLKIDQSFVRNLTVDPADAAICRAIVDLAHNLRMSVVAEGVETKSQAEFLRQSQCDELQGYYFARPLRAADFAQLLAQHARPYGTRMRATA
ncbi:MAG TPA: GGDEF domain-containing protein, partial [Telluria sp.]|nr:GGDEF domain-containing protein [Telluria sp.]